MDFIAENLKYFKK